MKHNLSLLAALLLAPLAALHAADAPTKKPNILFILTDDQGYGDVARHGHPLLKTPNQDALHDESVRFEKFYVSPSCSPTRAALMTGMHEFRSGVTHTTEPREHMDVNAVILPQLLKSADYRTGFIGKWHLGNDVPLRCILTPSSSATANGRNAPVIARTFSLMKR
jgi:arylsulfatase A-like enzyme